MSTQIPTEIKLERRALIHCAKAYLAQSRHFTPRARNFSFLLLSWAANCRKQAGATAEKPAQGELFGVSA